MDSYLFLEDYYTKDNNDILLHEANLADMTDAFKKQFAKLSISNMKKKLTLDMGKIELKLKEFDIDVKDIKKNTAAHSKNIARIIQKNYDNSVPIEKTAKELNSKIKSIVYSVIDRKSLAGSVAMGIFHVLQVFTLIMVLMTLLNLVLSLLIGDIVISTALTYGLSIFFLPELLWYGSRLVGSKNDDWDSNGEIGNLSKNRKKGLSGITDNNISVYSVRVLLQSFKDIIKNFKI